MIFGVIFGALVVVVAVVEEFHIGEGRACCGDEDECDGGELHFVILLGVGGWGLVLVSDWSGFGCFRLWFDGLEMEVVF